VTIRAELDPMTELNCAMTENAKAVVEIPLDAGVSMVPEDTPPFALVAQMTMPRLAIGTTNDLMVKTSAVSGDGSGTLTKTQLGRVGGHERKGEEECEDVSNEVLSVSVSLVGGADEDSVLTW
jgi:hypothetical protein